MEAVFALADRITRAGLRPRHRHRRARGDPRQRRGAPGLSRRQRRGWLPCLTRGSSSSRHRYLLRPQPGAVRPLARRRAGRDGDADGPQRHGQDHHRALDHGPHAGDCRLDPLRRRGDPRAPLLPRRAAGHRPGAGGAAGLSQSHRAREPGRHRRQPRRGGRSLDARQGLRAVPAAGRAHRQHGQPALRRRAADAGDRPRADDQSAAADPRRGDRRASPP